MSSLVHRRSGGASGGGAHDISPDVTTDAAVEENNAILRALLADVSKLKSSVTSTQEEVKEHLSLTDAIQNSLLSAKDGVVGTMRKLTAVSGLSSVAHMWLLFLFCFIVFTFIYFLLRRGSSS